MTTNRGLRACAGLSILPVLVVLPMACSKQEPAVAQSGRPESPPTGRAAPTDDYLTTYLTWYRDWKRLTNRQRIEMAPLMGRAPQGLMAQALDATVAGLGRLVIGPTGMTYVPGRNESALAAAREKYGKEFVDWVLAHESTIVGTLGQ